MKKRQQLQLTCSLIVAALALPFALYVVYERPLAERAWWLLGMAAIAVLFRKYVYEPIARRIPDE
jgi:uncharacterized membrane protein